MAVGLQGCTKSILSSSRLWILSSCLGAHISATSHRWWETGIVCSNYRGISIVSLPSKVHTGVLEKRVWLIVEPQVQEDKCGFRPGHGPLGHLHTLTWVLEGASEFAQLVDVHCELGEGKNELNEAKITLLVSLHQILHQIFYQSFIRSA